MGQILKKLNVLLDKKQKKTMAGLVLLMIVGAALQTAGVGMILPVVSLVLDQDVVLEQLSNICELLDALKEIQPPTGEESAEMDRKGENAADLTEGNPSCILSKPINKRSLKSPGLSSNFGIIGICSFPLPGN